MPLITKRIPFTPQNPYRSERPATSKIIFLSFEGSVTEEEYFERVSDVFSRIKSKIQFISVAEDAVHTHHKCRTIEQKNMLSKTRPKQLVERIEQFKKEKQDIYQFSEYPEDEFWIVTDVDNNWSSTKLSDSKTMLDEWNEAIIMCEGKGYGYAISNPFFEIWLLLHHDFPNEEDKFFAVTDEHEYEPTTHFKERLKSLGVPMKSNKHILGENYTLENIKKAIEIAKKLHINPMDKQPKYFATTVYILLEKIVDMAENYGNDI